MNRGQKKEGVFDNCTAASKAPLYVLSLIHIYRNSTFQPQVVRKRQKDISSIDQKIISMYAKGMTTRQISETLEDIYGFEASEGFISDVTDKILPQIEDWQKRPLSEVYPVLYIDAIHYSCLLYTSQLKQFPLRADCRREQSLSQIFHRPVPP